MTPILVHVGFHKTATNWLQAVFFGDPATGYRWLGKRPLTHPVHRLVRDRPVEFDAAAVQAEFEPLVADARAADLVPVVSFPRLSGHPYSGGYDSKEIADRVQAVFPEARILIVIREQRSMIVSTCKQYVSAGGLSTPGQLLTRTRAQTWRVPGFDLAHFEYDRLIRYYRSLYGPEAVLVLAYEQFVRDGRGFISAIARFAGRPVSDELLDGLPYGQRSNQALSALAAAATRPLNRLGPRSDLNPAPLFESRVVFGLAKALRGSDLPSAPPLRPLAARSERRLRRAVEEAVGERYVESNRATRELTGLDLAAYGWMV